MSPLPPPSEDVYDRIRLRQWSAGTARSAGIDRRDLLKLVAAASAAVPLASVAAPAQAAAAPAAPGLPGVVKPLPPELFTLRGTNAETNFAALKGTGLLTPADRFLVRNHTATPHIDRDTWKLTIWGDGLKGGPVDFSYADLLRLPSVSRTGFVECAGNGRSFFASQQGQAVSGTAWTLGAIGAARWRGVRLGDVLRRAGIGRHAVDVLPRGLDGEVVTDRVNLGRVRRHQMGRGHRGERRSAAHPVEHRPLPAVRSRVSAGGQRPADPADAEERLRAGAGRLVPRPSPHGADRTFLVGRGAGEVGGGQHRGGQRWRRARLHDVPRAGSWVRWSVDWVPTHKGATELLARATDRSGRTQPKTTAHNTQGYLFDAVVPHPVTVN